MNTEMLMANQGPALREQLAELEVGPDETRAGFLGRAAVVAWERDETILDSKDLNYIRELLPGWHFASAGLRGRQFGRADRLAPATTEQLASLGTYTVEKKRVVGLDEESKSIVLLTQSSTFTRGDIACVFEIEAASETSSRALAMPPPKLRKEHSGVNQNSPEAAKRDETSGLSLTGVEKKTIKLTALPLEEIGELLDIEKSAVSKRLTFAMERNGLERAEFLDRAVSGKLIDMTLLPPPQKYELSESELTVLRDYPFSKLADTASGLGLSTNDKASHIRRSISEKLGLKNATQTRVYIAAKRDGII